MKQVQRKQPKRFDYVAVVAVLLELDVIIELNAAVRSD